MNLIDHLRRQMAFSRATYGPGERTNGVCDHIKKEIEEIKNAPDGGLRSSEWRDVAILAFDGWWRALEAEGVKWRFIPRVIAESMAEKQSINEQREWPDWRGSDPDKAIEHVRKSAP